MDLADAATDYGDEVAARDAQRAVAAIVDDAEAVEAGRSEYLEARWPACTRVLLRRRLIQRPTICGLSPCYDVACYPSLSTSTCGLHLPKYRRLGSLAFRRRFLHASSLGLVGRKRTHRNISIVVTAGSLETLAMTALLDACLSGRTASGLR